MNKEDEKQSENNMAGLFNRLKEIGAPFDKLMSSDEMSHIVTKMVFEHGPKSALSAMTMICGQMIGKTLFTIDVMQPVGDKNEWLSNQGLLFTLSMHAMVMALEAESGGKLAEVVNGLRVAGEALRE